ncbi:MAG: hypothetical protein ACYDCF_08655 [Burkholderiales bacterium]
MEDEKRIERDVSHVKASFDTTDPVALKMLERINASPYTLGYLLGQRRGMVDKTNTVQDNYALESLEFAQGEFADEIDAILNARIQQNKLAMAEKGWRADPLHDDLTRSDFVASRIHLEPDLNAMGYMNGITYQIIQDGKLVQSIRDYLDVSSTQLADNLHSVANEANMDAAERAAAANSGDPYPEDVTGWVPLLEVPNRTNMDPEADMTDALPNEAAAQDSQGSNGDNILLRDED